ncbi:hypothetical protein [Aquimarina intermedia]|uniref:PKD domain-containing protein n=1 Tax=Aquimarina intermedia TaxID=350814 RepID=A0A5S5C4M1_9FLAO|nr:hypothetical protein [Aquimarina intermedia]TYP74371.1 hypothetical protein BD809_104191 [Aquimarina intermedia]
MKFFKHTFRLFLLLLIIQGCNDDDNFDYLNKVDAPANIAAAIQLTQDNTGLVTITPKGDGVVSFDIYFGDETEAPVNIQLGEVITHAYTEGTYDLRIIGIGITGLKTEAIQQVVISFNAPENLEVVIANDEATSKQVNVTATADYAMSFDVYFGEEGNDAPVSATIGEVASYTYQQPGTYTIKVVAKGGAIATTEYSEVFEVTEILQPVASAPTPPARAAQDVMSVFSAAYTDEPGTDYFPDWGQGSQGSSWSLFDLNGDAMLQYINLSYQGIQFGAAVDVSAMEFFHMDVWTSGDVTAIETSLISQTNGEKPFSNDLVAGQWTAIDIPISAFTDQGLTVADIHQLKFVGTPWAEGTVFIDNIYFYKGSAQTVTAAPTPTVAAANVISMFSDAYTDVTVDTWRTSWSDAVLEDVTVEGNATKKYSALNFVGIETTSAPIDATAMTHFHTDVWSDDFTEFKIKLVDFGADGLFQGGDDVEHEITISNPAVGEWVSLAIPLSDFTGLTTRANIAQLIYVGSPTGATTVYIDNVYFHN